jgi:ATP-dependent protease HslVU (ClpYQ) peptidase subunit
MTCIAGLEHEGRVWIGGDSAGVAGLDVDVRADEKVFRNGEMLIGFAGSFRMGQLLRYAWDPPTTPTAERDDMGFLVVDVMDSVRALLEQHGYLKKKHDVETLDDGLFLLGYRGRLYRVDADLQVGRSRHGYAAIGCGESYALGSLHATADIAAAAPRRIRSALKAATVFSGGVRGPYVVMSK